MLLVLNIFMCKLVVTDKKRVLNTPLTVYVIYIKRTNRTKKELINSKKRSILTFIERIIVKEIK